MDISNIQQTITKPVSNTDINNKRTNNSNNIELQSGYQKGANHTKDLILVVDDDTTFLKLITRILQQEGYEVDSVETGQDALDKTKENYYALILVDRKLPDTDGVELLNKIEDTDPEMRKIIFTGFPSIDNIQEAISLGAHAYLTKPIDPQEIIVTVKEQLEKRNKEFKDKYPTLK